MLKLNFSGDQALIPAPFEQGVLVPAYRRLKRHLLEKLKTPFLLVSSLEVGEGKTTTSINLATSFSLEREGDVCLIDCNGDASNLLNVLQVKATSGLIDYLEKNQNQNQVSDLILETNFENIKILPYGRETSRRYELLSSKKMQTLMHSLSTEYQDTIFILDLPSLSFPESQFLIHLFGNALLVVERGKTPVAKAKEFVQMLGKDKFIGISFNKASSLLDRLD